jgi:hypothetical protein
MKNQCIKVLNKEHGKKVIEYFKSLGGDKDADGDCIGWYYGIFNGKFNLNLTPYDSEVIELPTEPEFKRGDKVWVWDDDDVISERIFLTKIEGAAHPYICVMKGKESAFLKGEPYLINIWKNCKHSIQIELTLQDISDGKGVGVDPKLIKIILI